jgi:hypothetical protein
VHEIQELQFELPTPDSRRIASVPRLKLILTLVVGAVAALLGALVLSLLFAHPAGAAVPPGSDASGSSGEVSSGVQPVVATIAGVASPVADSVAPATSPVFTTLAPVLIPTGNVLAPITQPAVPTLTPVLQSVLQSVAPAIDPLVATLRPVLAPVVTALVPAIGPIAAAGPSQALRPTLGPRPAERSLPNASTNVHIAPVGPAPTPNPAPPMPRLPAVAVPSATDGSSSPSGGSSSPAAQQPTDLLLPAPMVTAFTLGRAQSPELLLDLRHSPPG